MEGKSYPNKGNIVVGNDVWIGYNATIMSGVIIGDGSIIATNTPVTKDVAPYSIVGDNSAKAIRKRFEDDTIKKLLDMQWWNWDIVTISKNVQALTGSDTNELDVPTRRDKIQDISLLKR